MKVQTRVTYPIVYIDPKIKLREFPELEECSRCHDKFIKETMYDIGAYTDFESELICEFCIEDVVNMPPCTYCGRRKHINYETDFRGIKVPVCRKCSVITQSGEEPKQYHQCNCKYCNREFEE